MLLRGLISFFFPIFRFSYSESEVKIYKVVKCGVSGHNIRAYPSLKAPTVGMIYAEQKVTSDEQVSHFNYNLIKSYISQ